MMKKGREHHYWKVRATLVSRKSNV